MYGVQCQNTIRVRPQSWPILSSKKTNFWWYERICCCKSSLISRQLYHFTTDFNGTLLQLVDILNTVLIPNLGNCANVLDNTWWWLADGWSGNAIKAKLLPIFSWQGWDLGRGRYWFLRDGNTTQTEVDIQCGFNGECQVVNSTFTLERTWKGW